MTSSHLNTNSNNNNKPVPGPEVAMFLRKTYTMIDTCEEPSILEWCNNGTAFVVKDPIQLSKTLIPQFFKHSKFSSFVRQLNFYSFRKVPVYDGVRIDPELEAETRNYWKFQHPLFQQGRPELLTQMKRMTSSSSSPASGTTSGSSVKPDATPSSSATTVYSDKSTQAMQQEMQAMKQRMEEMNRTMDALATMVQQVTLVDNTNNTSSIEINDNHKRPRVDDIPDGVPSMAPIMAREASNISTATDQDFVDQLYEAFAEDDNTNNNGMDNTDMDATSGQLSPLADLEGLDPEALLGEVMSEEPQSTTTTTSTSPSNNNNRPDTALMDRLSDALSVLPKEMQSQLVERLIANITASVLPHKMLPVPHEEEEQQVEHDDDDKDDQEQQHVPLAAATLASLLAFYTSQLKQQQSAHASSSPSSMWKHIPIIPAH